MGDFMSNLTVSGVTLSDEVVVMITAKTAAETTAPFPIRANTKYTLLGSTLGISEDVLGEIYDPSKSAWQAWYYEGLRVKLTQYQEQLCIENISAMIRFVKPITSQAVGLSIFYN